MRKLEPAMVNVVWRRPGSWIAAEALGSSGIIAATGVSAPPSGADTSWGAVGFDAPVFVDPNLGSGEPSVIYDAQARDYIYTSHEGTTHTLHDGVAGAPASTTIWAANYRNQVNVWTSPDGYTWTRTNFDGTGFTSNPATNTGFSDPDLTMDAGARVYDTGIDLANDALFFSTDGGKTWPTGTINCHDGDRPWLAGARPDEVFLATDPVETNGHTIYRSTDGERRAVLPASPTTAPSRPAAG